jgi:hypothetical protein
MKLGSLARQVAGALERARTALEQIVEEHAASHSPVL